MTSQLVTVSEDVCYYSLSYTNGITVVGADDPYLHGSLALYNVCDEENAAFFDHGKGHTLPRDPRTIKELGDVIRSMLMDVSGSGITTPQSMQD